MSGISSGNGIIFCHILDDPNDLRFGLCESGGGGDVSLTINATVAWPVATITDSTVVLLYDSNVWRGIVSSRRTTNTPPPQTVQLHTRCDYELPKTTIHSILNTTTPPATTKPHRQLDIVYRSRTSQARVLRSASILYSERLGVLGSILVLDVVSKPITSHLKAIYARTLHTQCKIDTTNLNSVRIHRSGSTLTTIAISCGYGFLLTNSTTRYTARSRHLVYSIGKPLTAGYHRLVANLGGKTPLPGITGNDTTFCCSGDGNNLIFNCCAKIIPSKKVYIMNNSFSLIRLDNNKEILCESFSISIDSGSWTWSWNAKSKSWALNSILANDWTEPVVVLATLNGTAFKLLVEKMSRDRSFGSDGVSFSGRGWSALLDAPYAPITTLYSPAAITAQQACEQALTFNAVPIGWDVYWFIDDWLIAGKALTNTGTYINHILTIAEAAGGYVQPSRTLQSVLIKPYYGYNQDGDVIAPWNWESEFNNNNLDIITLPEAICETEVTEWSFNPEYNAVWVSGGEWGGRLDKMIRAGTAGDYMASTVSSNLATDPIMTRQRGIKELGDAGRVIKISLSIPIIAELGILETGTMVRYVAGGISRIGIVRSVGVSYSFPKARQSLEIESHEYL